MNQNLVETTNKFAKTRDVPNTYTGCCFIVSHNQVRYYKNGNLHRLDGPAIIEYNRHSSKSFYWWFVDDERLVTEEMFYNHPKVISQKLKMIVIFDC